MEAQFRAIYGDNLNLAIIPSTLQLLSDDGLSSPSQEVGYTDGTFCLGHISNLQLAKGLDLVLIVFRQLRQRNRDVRLVLAGPIDSLAERQMIESAQAEFGHRFEYRGPVYGPDKEKFFNDIHAKIYPTRLDAQPLVIMEAFRHGRPVLSYARGCIPEMMPRPEWSIDVHADFVASAVQQIESWIDDRQSYIEACRLARQRCLASMDEARAALGNFVNWVCFESDSGFVRRSPAD
jgi:glycosyltransferase involved in cell wall biosynthesis